MKYSRATFCGKGHFPGVLTMLFLVSLLLSGCGSGGSGSSSQTTIQTTAVAGIAAAGAPLSGKVHLSDSSSFKIYSSNSTINRDGSFSINTTGMNAPFILRVDDIAGNTLYYSFAKEHGIVHINPLTNLAVTVAAAAGNTDLATLFAGHTKDKISGAMSGALSNIMNSLLPLLSLYIINFNPDKADPLSDPYQVNKQGLDGLFDDVSFTVFGGMVTITRKDTNTTVFSSSISDLISSPNSAGLVMNNLPTPTSYATPGNAELTLKVQGNLPQGTLIKNVSFSIQLPLGISVTRDSNALNGLNGVNAVENTAVPVGTATGSNVYPPPLLSDMNNILTVAVSSPAGFGVGDFIKIRCVVSSPSLMDATTPGSFSVTSSSIYSDIYSSQKLKGLNIVPDRFAATAGLL